MITGDSGTGDAGQAAGNVRTRPEMSGSAATPTDQRRNLYVIFGSLMAGLFLSELDQTIFATALPTIVGELRGVDRMLWVTTAYILTATIMMPIYGKLSDLIGRKPLFVAALSIFLLGSVMGGLAPDMTWLIAGRAVQGLGGGGLLILVQAIIADLIPARRRARYLSAMGAVFAASSMLGPPLGGWLAATVGWRWAFWINLPVGGLAIALAAVFLRLPVPRRKPFQLDIWGMTMLAIGVTSLVLISAWAGTAHEWTSPLIVSFGVVVVAAGSAFVVAERRAAEPLIPLSLFRDRNFTCATAAGLMFGLVLMGAIVYLPTYLQMVDGLSPTRAGLMMLTLIAGLAVSTIASAQLVTRTGRYRIPPILGAMLVAVALALLSTLPVKTNLMLTGVSLFALGAGLGCALQILLLIVQNSVQPSQLGTATAVHDFSREIGVALGSAAVGALFTGRLQALLAERLPATIDANALTPALVEKLPDPTRATVIATYHDALTPVFGYLVPLMLLSMIGLLAIRPEPLAETVPDQRIRGSELERNG
jgi:EmrB/QacA subfamily drug resistance transporter